MGRQPSFSKWKLARCDTVISAGGLTSVTARYRDESEGARKGPELSQAHRHRRRRGRFEGV